jgi:hypothetical protein
MPVAAATAPALSASGVATPDDDLTEDHMRLLGWLAAHPTESLAAAAQALDLTITDPDHPNARSGRSLLTGQFAARRGKAGQQALGHRGVLGASRSRVNRLVARGISRSSESDGCGSQYGPLQRS